MNDFDFSRERTLKKIQAYITRMPGLSTTVVKVMETCNDPGASANDLKRIISLDPVLTARVLKLINSAYYSLRHPVASLSRAIIMLGVNTVKNLALSFTIIDNLKSRRSGTSFSADDFWGHSLCVGVVAKLLAKFSGVPAVAREEYFVAGLLHDIGKLPLQWEFPSAYKRICEFTDEGRKTLYRNETRVLGIDHCMVGHIIGKKWHLGSTLLESMAYHHNPGDGADDCRKFVTTVSLANQLTVQLKIGNAGDHYADPARIDLLMADVGLEPSMLKNLPEAAGDEIDRAKSFLEVVQYG